MLAIIDHCQDHVPRVEARSGVMTHNLVEIADERLQIPLVGGDTGQEKDVV